MLFRSEVGGDSVSWPVEAEESLRRKSLLPRRVMAGAGVGDGPGEWLAWREAAEVDRRGRREKEARLGWLMVCMYVSV